MFLEVASIGPPLLFEFEFETVATKVLATPYAGGWDPDRATRDFLWFGFGLGLVYGCSVTRVHPCETLLAVASLLIRPQACYPARYLPVLRLRRLGLGPTPVCPLFHP